MGVQENKEVALKIKAVADELGWSCTVRSNNVLTITKAITPHSREAFVEADGEYYSILSLLPQTSPGSTWGTDGGGIGGMSAINNGRFVMNKSGGNKNILRHLSRLNLT